MKSCAAADTKKPQETKAITSERLVNLRQAAEEDFGFCAAESGFIRVLINAVRKVIGAPLSRVLLL